MEFNIGDRVKVKNYDLVDKNKKVKVSNGDPRLWATAKAKNCGKLGTIVDKMYSNAFDCNVYIVRFDGFDANSRSNFVGEDLVLVREEHGVLSIEIKIDKEKGIAIATMVETSEYGINSVVESAFGYIREDNYIGIAQAVSFATHKLYEKIGG